MITPAPTSKVDPEFARGILAEVVAPTAMREAYVVLEFPNTSYKMRLIPAAPVTTKAGSRILGVVRRQAKRIDVVQTGGSFVEPVFGRPRRVQGRVVSQNKASGTVTVNAGIPIVCTLTDSRQSPTQFAVGAMVAFDVLPGASFEPQAE